MTELIIFTALILLILPLIAVFLQWFYADKEQDEIDERHMNDFINETTKNK